MSKPVYEDLFSFSGRRNRKSFFLHTIGFVLPVAFAGGFMFGLGGAAAEGSAAMGLFVLVSIALFAMLAWSSWAVGSQRVRDMGYSGWMMLLSLLPLVGWIFALAIYFWPSTDGPNAYGDDPRV